MSDERQCIGFGEREGICQNPAGTPWTPLWCVECDQQRRDHISRQMEQIAARLDAAGEGRVTHGRHCPCSACAREDWTNPNLAPCGMHGSDCPNEYAPMLARLPAAGEGT